jgi:hypothetical protein
MANGHLVVTESTPMTLAGSRGRESPAGREPRRRPRKPEALGLAVVPIGRCLLADQIQRGGGILIVGDYDADGATGSAVALLGLRALGARGSII